LTLKLSFKHREPFSLQCATPGGSYVSSQSVKSFTNILGEVIAQLVESI
jgi:hypothetical protein